MDHYGWKYVDEQGTFRLEGPEQTSYLYFPLVNEAGMMSSISPLLQGDCKTGQNTFALIPVSQEDLHNAKSARNFWLIVNDREVWSVAGNSSAQIAKRFDGTRGEKVILESGFLWHKVTRESGEMGLKAEITSFVPVTGDAVELMKVTITNVGQKKVKISPIAAIPIYGRSADNLRDHRHVTSLLHRIQATNHGVVVKPTLSFDERGHTCNQVSYGVLGAEGEGIRPTGYYPILEDFIGEGGCLEWPESIVKNRAPRCFAGDVFEGYEAVGGLRFREQELEQGESMCCILAITIDPAGTNLDWVAERYLSTDKFNEQLERNREFWAEKLGKVSFARGNTDFNYWMKWVTLQPILRRIYGCSFLPHHDYGRGGRGWRDLWQDCLGLLLTEPEAVRKLLFNNYAGVRFDGSNATIIGSKPGEFIADRNNIARVWMDHGAWPFLTTKLYIDQTGDIGFLLEEQSYFKDAQICRSRERDNSWSREEGCSQLDRQGSLYRGTILEHLLLQHLTPFFNVGMHNIIKLEGADWNDGLDMADENGESTAFTALYGSNLSELCDLLRHLEANGNVKEVEIASELFLLLDTLGVPIEYNSAEQKHRRLTQYYDTCRRYVSGERKKVKIQALIGDLEHKAGFIASHIREQEWVCNQEGFGWYNGYYDNHRQRVEGDHPKGTRMTLTGQVFTIMGGIAAGEQVKQIISSADRYLLDERLGGYRLNTDFGEVKTDLGRCFGFAYGHKENGAVFSHMAVMYAYALYRRGFAKAGFKVLDLLFRHCSDFEKSRIYPGIPEYINQRGRGMYHYLTGSASWMMLTVITQMYGVRGEIGDLAIEPKLCKEQFDSSGIAGVNLWFANRQIEVLYKNTEGLDPEEYSIKALKINGQEKEFAMGGSKIRIPRSEIRLFPEGEILRIEVELG